MKDFKVLMFTTKTKFNPIITSKLMLVSYSPLFKFLRSNLHSKKSLGIIKYEPNPWEIQAVYKCLQHSDKSLLR